MWPVVFTEAARGELINAQDWYEAEAPGLGRRFRAEIDSAVQRMADNPRQFPVVFKTLRRARAKKFPYALFFLIEPDTLLVVACFHIAGLYDTNDFTSEKLAAWLRDNVEPASP